MDANDYKKTITEAVDVLVDKVVELNSINKEQVSTIECLTEEIDSHTFYDLPKHFQTLRVSNCLDDLINNIESIPIEEIENLVNKFRKK